MPKRKTKEEFVIDAKKIHLNKYKYDKIEYINNRTKVLIICKKHGEFWQSPECHLQGQGCNDCSGRLKLTKMNFIERANKVHDFKFNYSKSKINRTKDKTEIICPEHGSFLQSVANHLKGNNCPTCGQLSRATSQRYSKDEFLKSLRKIHGDKYDYSKLNYVNSQTKITINCPKHGDFKMKPNSHYNGQGCPECGKVTRNNKLILDYEKFLKRAIKTHKSRYIYDKSSYKKYTLKMRMFCSEHGWFLQTPHSHISMKSGCRKCGQLEATKLRKYNWETVSNLIESVHGNKYDYSLVKFVGIRKKVKIICQKHGVFEQEPFGHYNQGAGCPDCAREIVNAVIAKRKITFKIFHKRSIKVHGNKYRYNPNEYVDQHTPVKIECQKHGYFLQKPIYHYYGSGCPKCISSKGENKIRNILKKYKINFKEQKIFKDLKHKNNLRCDFFLPNYQTVIEYNGMQHYQPVEIFGGLSALEYTQMLDNIKYNFLKKNSIKLIVIRYDNIEVEKTLVNRLDIKKD